MGRINDIQKILAKKASERGGGSHHYSEWGGASGNSGEGGPGAKKKGDCIGTLHKYSFTSEEKKGSKNLQERGELDGGGEGVQLVEENKNRTGRKQRSKARKNIWGKQDFKWG